MVLAITFYSVVLFIHIAAVVVAFGVIFTYPLLGGLVRKHPQHAATVYRMQAEVGKKVISPGLLVILIAGIYLASDSDAWGEFWVIFPLLGLFAAGAIGGAFLGPREEKAAELAERDLGPSRTGTLSTEFNAVVDQIRPVQYSLAGLVILIIFVMVTKPFA